MFRPTVARLQALIQWVGSTKPADLPLKWQMPVIQVAEAEAKKNPKFTKAKLKGGPHKSHSDKQDPRPVVSLQFLREDDKRIKTLHVHEDGSTQERASTATPKEESPAPSIEGKSSTA